ncbi:MAG: hypothetical protein RIR26_46 [Pseudomonadota bacterium]|jgi:hypothetical protein
MKHSGWVHLLTCFVVAGCSGGGFTALGPRSAKTSKSTAGESPAANSGDRAAQGEGAVAGSKKATFNYGPKSSPSDFLFVFDNSGSMKAPLDSMKAGFASLSQAVWSADTRIAVMTTLPGDPSNLSQVHPDVNAYSNIDFEPGFLSLMSEQARKNFLSKLSPNAEGINSYPLTMCASEWFQPSDKNPQGIPCLSAAVQSVFHGVGAEAGLTAVKQILQKRPNLFRAGTNVNIVFVSDTQDPGQGDTSSALFKMRPDYAQLKSAIEANSVVAGFKFHGVTPSLTCKTGEGTPASQGRGLPYQDVIKASGGVWLDFCDGGGIRSDYTPVATQIVSGALPLPVFVLPVQASKIVQVVAAGAVIPTANVFLSADKRTVRVSGLAPEKDVDVAISYLP